MRLVVRWVPFGADCCKFAGAVIAGLNARRGTITDSEVREEEFTCTAEVALNDMFGYSSHLRGVTQGKGTSARLVPTLNLMSHGFFAGEFSMEYKVRSAVMSAR